jgi:hypothetical protein
VNKLSVKVSAARMSLCDRACNDDWSSTAGLVSRRTGWEVFQQPARDEDLPGTKNTRRIKRLIRLERPLRPDELQMVRSAMKNWRSLALSQQELRSTQLLVAKK